MLREAAAAAARFQSKRSEGSVLMFQALTRPDFIAGAELFAPAMIQAC